MIIDVESESEDEHDIEKPNDNFVTLIETQESNKNIPPMILGERIKRERESIIRERVSSNKPDKPFKRAKNTYLNLVTKKGLQSRSTS